MMEYAYVGILNCKFCILYLRIKEDLRSLLGLPVQALKFHLLLVLSVNFLIFFLMESYGIVMYFYSLDLIYIRCGRGYFLECQNLLKQNYHFLHTFRYGKIKG